MKNDEKENNDPLLTRKYSKDFLLSFKEKYIERDKSFYSYIFILPYIQKNETFSLISNNNNNNKITKEKEWLNIPFPENYLIERRIYRNLEKGKEFLKTLPKEIQNLCIYGDIKRETDRKRLFNRQKQIDIGFYKIGYNDPSKILDIVFQTKEEISKITWIPNKYQVCSNRSWHWQVTYWKKTFGLFLKDE